MLEWHEDLLPNYITALAPLSKNCGYRINQTYQMYEILRQQLHARQREVVKILLVMKLTILFLMIMILQANAEVFAQKVTLSEKNASLTDIFEKIRIQTGYDFLFTQRVLKHAKPVNIKANNDNIEQVLKKIFINQELDFEIKSNSIIVTPKASDPIQNNLTSVKQDIIISGKVVDNNDKAIFGATIKVKNSEQTVMSDQDGAFRIKTNAKTVTLLVSFMGYDSQEVTVVSGSPVVIRLTESNRNLEEIVVVAYGTQKKSNLTGSVEVVTAKSLENRPVTSATAMLQGNVAGMTFSTPSGGNTPGANMTIQIRGQAALSGATPPLVVIDGIPSDMGAFNALNPNSIESISVLKDAAATAVYGARAPYGVLVVNTKMGQKNEKPKISYSGNFGIVSPVRVPKMVDSYTFALARNQAALNSRQPVLFGDDQINLIWDNIQNPGKYTDEELNPVVSGRWEGKPAYNNDFIDVWLRSSFRQQHDLSLRGGGERSSYFVSAGYVHQPGNLNFVNKFDNYKRFNLNGGLVADVGDWMKITYRSRYSNELAKEPTTEYDQGRERLYTYAYGSWPMLPVYNPDGSMTGATRIAVGAQGGERRNDQHRIDNILAFDFTLAKGLTAHVDGTWRMNFQDYQSLRKPVYASMPSGDSFLVDGTESYLSKQTALNRYWTLQGYAAYEKEFNGHSFRLQVGSQAEENNYRMLSGYGKDLFITDLDALAIAQGDRSINDAINDWATAGFFGRFNYNFKERYLIELNGRKDGSGRYARGQRWGVFPSGSVGWVLSKEAFWKSIEPVINFSKLRMSYGTLGNQGNSAGYLHIPTITVQAQTPWIFNGERLPYVQTPGILNMNRTWEKITTFEVGAEFGLLDNRLTIDANYFKRRSWDIIGPPTPKAAVLGVSAPQVNNAEFVTKGFELMLGWRDNITPNWSYNTRLLLSDGKSTITKYNTATNSISGWYVGKEMGEIWGYQADRLLRKEDFGENGKLLINQDKIHAIWYPGDVKYEDIDGDGIITTGTSIIENSGDLKIIGNSTPRYRYSINLGTEYDFDNAGKIGLSVLLEGIAKRDVFFDNSYFYWGAPPAGWESSRARSIYQGNHLDFYRDETTEKRLLDLMGVNTNSYFPRPYESTEGNKNMKTNTRYLLNGAYMRLKNLNLSYTLPKNWLQRMKIESCQVYFSGENMFVLSGMPSYLDPETVGGGRMYPQHAVYSFGINVGF